MDVRSVKPAILLESGRQKNEAEPKYNSFEPQCMVHEKGSLHCDAATIRLHGGRRMAGMQKAAVERTWLRIFLWLASSPRSLSTSFNSPSVS